MKRCEICGEWLPDEDFLEESIWDEAITLCERCEEMINCGVLLHRQKGR
jgi:hypothetical protein